MLWSPGQPVRSDAPVYCRSEDFSHLDPLLKVPCGPCPLAVEVTPNGELRVYLIDLVVTIDSDQAQRAQPTSVVHWPRDLLNRQSSVVRTLMHRLTGLAHAAAATEPGALVASCWQLQESIAELEKDRPGSAPPRLADAVNILICIGEKILHPMLHGAFYQHVDTNPHNKAWWNRPSPLKSACGDCLVLIRRTFGQNPPPGIQAIREWLQALESVLTKLNQPATNVVVAMEAAAALCAGLADRHMRAMQCSLGLLYLHRSVDLLLQSRCAEMNLLELDRTGARYRYSAPGRSPYLVQPLDSIAQIESTNPFRPEWKDRVVELNSWRNLLLHAHHFSSCDPGVAIPLYKAVRLGLSSGSRKDEWEKHADLCGSPLPMDVSRLLDLDGTLRTSFVVR